MALLPMTCTSVQSRAIAGFSSSFRRKLFSTCSLSTDANASFRLSTTRCQPCPASSQRGVEGVKNSQSTERRRRRGGKKREKYPTESRRGKEVSASKMLTVAGVLAVVAVSLSAAHSKGRKDSTTRSAWTLHVKGKTSPYCVVGCSLAGAHVGTEMPF